MSTPFYDLASLVVVPSGYKASKVYAQKPLTTDGQLTFSRASTATRVNSAGLIETVSSNVPRLDYLGSTCPKLQLEPQRTNVLVRSSEFENSAWSATSSNITIAANDAVSPDGNTNADKITYNTSSGYLASASYLGSPNTATTASIFVKAGSSNLFNLGLSDGTLEGFYYTFNLSNQTATIGSTLTYWSNPSYKIQAYGNGWYRISVSAVSTVNGIVLLYTPAVTGLTANYHIYGAQLEVGAYPTSYIPTTTAAVTRLADACSKTGISSLIGQTEGTLFVDTSDTFYQSGGTDIWLMQSSVNDTNTAILIYYTPTSGLTVFLNNGTASIFMQAPFTLNQRNKVAVAYKNGDYALALNGLIVDTDSSAIAPPSGMNQVAFVKWVGIGNAQKESVNQALVFKTRLTNAQLAELTTL